MFECAASFTDLLSHLSSIDRDEISRNHALIYMVKKEEKKENPRTSRPKLSIFN